MKEKDIQTLKSMLASENASNRYEALIAIGCCEKMFGSAPSDDEIKLVLPFLFDQNDHVRYYASDALGFLGITKAIPYLEKCIPVIDMGKSNTWIQNNIEWAINVLKTLRITYDENKLKIHICCNLPTGTESRNIVSGWLKVISYKLDALKPSLLEYDFRNIEYPFGDAIANLWIESKKNNIETKIIAHDNTLSKLYELMKFTGVSCDISAP